MTRTKNKREVTLSAEIATKLIFILRKEESNQDLNVKEKQQINRLIGQLQAKLDAAPKKGINLSNKFVGTILVALANLLSDSRIVKTLLDLFFGNKK